MNSNRRLWIGLGALLAVSFGVLLWVGTEIHRVMPPIPARVVSDRGEVLYTRADIQTGRQVWQSIGGHQLGSIWGHGSYVAPDWTADWLHREALELLDHDASKQHGVPFDELGADSRAAAIARLTPAIRRNTYDAATDTITVSADRGDSINAVAQHYISLFGDDPALLELRKDYAMKNGTVAGDANRRALTAFIWWSAWSATTERPGGNVTYTNNWPHEPLVGNTPPSHLLMWTVFSVLFLIAGIALLGWHHARHKDEAPPALPASDPLAMIRVTPSMRATAKYFWLVIALFLTQILLGAITAHYQVEGQEAYGFQLAEILPYSLSRTWHTQLAVLWIATAWLGMGLYIGPAISGHEPKFQRLGVNLLFSCLIIIVVGAFAGQCWAWRRTSGSDTRAGSTSTSAASGRYSCSPGSVSG
jgi:nitric oxide reductase subunit B